MRRHPHSIASIAALLLLCTLTPVQAGQAQPVGRDLVGYVGARLGSKPALWSGLIVGSLLRLGGAAMAETVYSGPYHTERACDGSHSL